MAPSQSGAGTEDDWEGARSQPSSVTRLGCDLLALCRERLATYEYPTSVDFVAALHRNATSKVLKPEVRAPY